MNANKLNLEVINSLKMKEEITLEYKKQKEKLKNDYFKNINLHTTFLNSIIERFEDLAIASAIEKKENPKDSSGDFWYPTEIKLIEGGVNLIWEYDDYNHSFFISFNELINIEILEKGKLTCK